MTSGTYTPRSTHGAIEMLLNDAERIFTRNGPSVALAHDVVAHLAERVLGGDPRLALGHLDDARHLGHDRPARHARRAAGRRSGRLADLLQPHPVAGEAVAVGVGPDLPVDLVPGHRAALVAAQVPVDAAAPGGWRPTGRTERATSRGMTPMPRVRAWKISLPTSRSSISSQNARILLHDRLASRRSSPWAGRPSGRRCGRSSGGSARRSTASIRLSTYSRSRNA